MKLLKRVFIFIGVWTAVAAAITLCAAIVLPAGEDGQVHLGSIYTLIILVVPAVVGTKAVKNSSVREKEKREQRQAEMYDFLHGDSFSVPRSSTKQDEIGKKLMYSAEKNLSLAYGTDYVPLFVKRYEDAIQDVERASQLEQASFEVDPRYKLNLLNEEFQLHICNAIVRNKKMVIEDINGKYKNSREYQEKALLDFEDDLKNLFPKFSDGTREVANAAIADVRNVLIPQRIKSKRADSVDVMTGVEFEAWCAELLKKLSYQKVELTSVNGDQGVDILAEKDGVKYAIQCKCYSSNLDNTPVQEVNAGKAVYHCHVGVVMTNRYFTKGAQEAASATGILLWDRDKVFEMAKEAEAL